MSSIQSLVPKTPKSWTIAGFSIVFVIVAIARLLGSNTTAAAALIVAISCLAVVALSWLLINFLMRRGRKRRQQQFDAGIAAREGIDDRRREWQGWVDELEKNGIDRYELPFYLLVGEPQSGKSVLLQNSDLRFLFGQSRLSGIGGTRGCDWWFTDEAVILDLAGRLFTHEGGASDEAEWEAFLDLVNNFRPLDPANGIMLVIPCDVLLGDSPEVCAQKASKSREALLSLTRKLEAKLPIYVILTKADKIFGFAETVHRLTLEQRHQMFGWSRSADHLEEPFDPSELRGAWDGIVERSDTLRNQMLATARLPEALPEVDRLLGFPEELRGLYGPLEAYLNRIFVGSDLVEQLYFRGLYLTSGLQSGAPIAKVFLDILDRPGEADGRDLEKLFVRQQAYFIKELIRDRVFSERGLVKPTSTRVERAKKKSWLGYGVAASVALLSLIWGVFEIRSNHEASGQAIYEAAIEAAATLQPEAIEESRRQKVDPLKVPNLLSVLERIGEARDREPTAMQRLHASRQPHLEALYETIYDRMYRFELQERASQVLTEATRKYGLEDDSERPAGHAELVAQAEAAVALGAGIRDAASAQKIAAILPAVNEAERANLLKRVEAAHESRGEDFTPDTRGSSVIAAASRLRGIWSATLDPVDPVCIDGTIGFCIGWRQLTKFDDEICKLGRESVPNGTAERGAYDEIERAFQIIGKLNVFLERTTGDPSAKTVIEFQDQDSDHPLAVLAEQLDELINEGESDETREWKRERDEIRAWLEKEGLAPQALSDGTTKGKEVIKDEQLESLKKAYLEDGDLRRVVSDGWLGRDSWTRPAELVAQVKEAIGFIESENATELVRSIASIKLRLARDTFLAEYPDWASLNRTLCAPKGAEVDPRSIESWVRTQEVILDLLDAAKATSSRVSPSVVALVGRLELCGEQGIQNVGDLLADDQANRPALEAIVRTLRLIKNLQIRGSETIQVHLYAVRASLEAKWNGLEDAWRSGDAAPAAPVIAEDAINHLSTVNFLGSAGDDDEVEFDVNRKAWIKKTSDRLQERLEAYATRIEDTIKLKVHLADAPDLSSAITRITGNSGGGEAALLGGSGFRPLQDWVKEVHRKQNVPEANDQYLERYFNQMGAPANEAWKVYQRASFAEVPKGRSRPEALFAYVSGFWDTATEQSLRKDDLAAQYFNPKHPMPAVTNDPDDRERGIFLDYSRALEASFDKVVIRQLRTDYLDELVGRVVENNPDQLLEFWYDPASPLGRGREPADPVQYFFADDGEYLRLLQRYQITENSSRDFRVQVDEIDEIATKNERDLWQLDHFLELMLLYVRGAKQVADLAELTNHPLEQLEDFEMSLVASTQPGGFENTWNNWDSFSSPLFTAGASTSIQDDPSPSEIIVTSPVKGWGFHEPREFMIRWRDRVGSGQGGWQSYSVPSSLVPLQLFWSDADSTWGRSGYRVQQPAAEVNFHVTADERAPFTLRIKPAPPRRPRLDPKDLRTR